MKNEFSIPALAWLILSITCLTLILAGLRATLKRAGWDTFRQQKLFARAVILFATWTILILILSYVGFFADFSMLPPRPALAILIPLPLIIAFSFSKTGTQLLKSVPPHWIVYMQSFRIVVELLLLAAFLNNKLPVQMTFEGKNYDIVTGLLALPVGYLLSRNKPYARKLAIVHNFLGIALLLNILIIAVLSMPTSIRYFMNEPSNTLVARFPYILLPGVLVPIAYSMHIFSLRQLLTAKKRSADVVGQTKTLITH